MSSWRACLARRADEDQGFTTIELLVSMSIMAVVSAAVLAGIVQAMQVSATTTLRVEAVNDMQRSLERITRGVRGADPISAATATSLTLTVYDDADQRRVLTYTLNGDVLSQREVTYPSDGASATSDATSDMVAGVTLPGGTTLFTYTDRTGGVWDGADVSDIAQVDVTIAVPVDGDSIQLTSSAQVRNAD